MKLKNAILRYAVLVDHFTHVEGQKVGRLKERGITPPKLGK